jgi:nucleoside-diphosphate-sugar epimerase
MEYLITGIKSGIGRYLYEKLGGVGLSRENQEELLNKDLKNHKFDVIIHCAFNSSKEISKRNLYQYYSDNVELTRKTLEIPHNKFIFFSSVDLYNKNDEISLETDEINLQNKDVYALTKSISEVLIEQKSKSYLILRPTTMLGSYSRYSTIQKLIKEENPIIMLRENSIYNFILYEDVLSFIKESTKKNLEGIFNLASNDNISLKEVVSILKKQINYGEILYKVGNISNRKINGITNIFNKTSLESFNSFLKNTRSEIH